MKMAKKTLVLLAVVALIALALPMTGAFAATPDQTQQAPGYYNGAYCPWHGYNCLSWNCWNYAPNYNWSNNNGGNGGYNWNNWSNNGGNNGSYGWQNRGMGWGCW